MTKIKENNTTEIDLNTLSTFLTDWDIRPEELKKIDEEKKWEIQKNDEQKDTWLIFDININSIDDIIDILIKNKYDFSMIEPNSEYIKIIFKKDQIIKEIKNIKFHIYSKILIQAKKISGLHLDETSIEQKWVGEYTFNNTVLEILSRTVPENFWEVLYIKIKETEKLLQKNKIVKKTLSAGTIFWFLGAIFVIVMILWAAFLTFVVFNAKTPSDVSFFANLWINLNDVNSFLFKMTKTIFSIVVFIETIILIIFLFKAILTKKAFKRKKIILFIVASLVMILSFSTGTLWITVDKKISTLPNWEEMSYGNIQIFDNDLLKSSNFGKPNALISDYSNIIGPIDLKFDLNFLQKNELSKWFQIQKYIWDFWDGKTIESQNPEIIQNFDKKWNFQVKLILEWIDKRFPNKISQKTVSDIPNISIPYIVKITQNKTNNGGTMINFDASELKTLWEIEWYFKEDLEKPAFVGAYFQPSKIYFEEESIGMMIKNQSVKTKSINRIFIVSWQKSTINGEMKYEASIDNDLEYKFKMTKLENTSGAWFIKNFKWIFENKEITKEADILNLEASSEVNFTFSNYGKQSLKIIITNTAGQSTEIIKEIDVPRKLVTKNEIEFTQNDSIMKDIKYDKTTREYSLFNIWTPTKLKFDTKYIRADNPMYTLEEVSWDVWSDGSIDSKEKFIQKDFVLWWTTTITVNYKFIHIRDKKEITNIKDIITLEFVEKEAIVSFEIKTTSDYAPIVASFDASLSKVKDDNIVKFIYDYGDGVIEERDALNPGHRYLTEWNYTIKLTVVTSKWKQYSLNKPLIIKSPISEWKITVSMKKSPLHQEIDFSSAWSVGQIMWYHWDFWDGTISTEANPSHAYSQKWNYTIVLTLEYSNNNIIKTETDIEITE